MSNLIKKVLILVIASLLITNTMAMAQTNLNSTGIGFRGSFYSPAKNSTSVRVSHHLGYSVNNSINAGGCIYVFSRLSDNTLVEFSIGNIASIEQEVSFFANQKVDLFNVTPILFGMRYDFLQNNNRSFLQPYIIGGLGAYVLSDVKLVQEFMRENVEVSTTVKPGLFIGSGINIHLSSWIALNLDFKYHFINLNPNYDHSGLEFGIGFNFSWGSFDN